MKLIPYLCLRKPLKSILKNALGVACVEKTALRATFLLKTNIVQDSIKCGHCVVVCPKGAVFMTGFDDLSIKMKEPVILDSQMLFDAIRTRRSIRQFTKQPVSLELIAQIIEAEHLMPTGGNAQDVRCGMG